MTRDSSGPYGTTADRLQSFAVATDARTRVAELAERYWERAAYALILISAAFVRFFSLGPRAMHHDESLHGFYSWEFAESLRGFFTLGTYNRPSWEHVPFMHGPFQFIGSGFLMWVFGDGEYQSRLLAATLGTAMVGLPLLLRKQLGVIGALAATAFIAFSPTLMYYSRFTREDIYTAFWTLGMVVFAWRYIASRKDYWLFLSVGFMAGSFLTKETTYLTVGAFLFFFNFLVALDFADQVRAKRTDMDTAAYVRWIVGLTFIAWLIALTWPWNAERRTKYGITDLPAEADLLVIGGLVAAPMYAAAIQELPGFLLPDHSEADRARCAASSWLEGLSGPLSWRNCSGFADSYVAKPERAVAYTSIFGLMAVSGVIGVFWNPRLFAIAAACFWVPVILLSTTFFTNMEGFFSVVWGSLDYWLSQQHERRGDQPDYYYFMTIPVYEFLTLGLAVAGGLYYAIRGKMVHAAIIGGALVAVLLLLLAAPHDPAILKCAEDTCKPSAKVGISIAHVILPFTIVLLGVLIFPIERFTRFLMFWLVITAFGLTVAGEKMPWLNVHIALPLAVLAGKFLGDVLSNHDLREDLPPFDRIAPYAYAAIASALAILVFALVGPFSVASLGGWALVAVAAVSVYWAWDAYSRRTAVQVALIGAVAAFGVFTLRAGVLASFGHPDNPYVGATDTGLAPRDYGEVPVELLVYTQSSGDIPVLRDRLDAYARQTGLGKNIPIVVDAHEGFTWPWAWYLRDYKSVQYPDLTSSQYQNWTPPAGAVLFVSDAARNSVNLQGYEPGIPYHHRRWFPEDYRTSCTNDVCDEYSSRDFFKDLFTPSRLGDWLDFWVRRTLPADAPGTTDGLAFFPIGAGVAPVEPAGPTVRQEGTQLVIGGRGSGRGQLDSPADVAFDAQGNIYIADPNNDRIQKYDAQGVIQAVAGGFGGTAGVTLEQPWSIAVAGDGTVFVADTWNHKVVKLDSSLQKVDEWGAGGQITADDDDPFKLYGPRDIALAPGGNVLITDTGNSRVVEYTADGEFVRQFGRAGSSGAPLEFSEPVGLLVNAQGDIYIGDTWNKRVVVLDRDLNQKQIITVQDWGSRFPSDKSYIALLPDGRLLATVPNPCPDAAVGAPSDQVSCPQPQLTGRIVVFDAAGQQVASYEVPRETGNDFARPVGIATDGTSVLVADSQASVVRKIPLSEIAP